MAIHKNRPEDEEQIDIEMPKAFEKPEEADIEVILAEFTLAGVAPGMESLLDAKNASIAAAKDAARKRAA